MNLALIQNASGPYVPLLELSLPIHLRWCERHQVTYIPSFGRLCDRGPNWDRFPLLLSAMEHESCKPFDAVLWVDADCLIIGDNHFWPPGDICMVRHHNISWKDWGWHWNAGVMALKNTRRTRKFLEDVWEQDEVENQYQWKNQATIHEVLESEKYLVTELGVEWNSCRVNECAKPQVLAWHGLGPERALAAMRAELYSLEYCA